MVAIVKIKINVIVFYQERKIGSKMLLGHVRSEDVRTNDKHFKMHRNVDNREQKNPSNVPVMRSVLIPSLCQIFKWPVSLF